MKVRVWIGPAGSGKTSRALAALRKCEHGQRPALLIVPDQFTYTADRLLLEDPGLPGTRFVRVISFRRLAHLAAQSWEADPPPVSAEGQRLLLRGIVHTTSPEKLGPLASVRQTPGFVDALATTVQELKAIAGAQAADRLTSAADDPKATALAGLIRRYDTALKAAGLTDPDEWIHGLAERLAADPQSWAGREIWVDGFMSLTPTEKALLEALGRSARTITVTLCGDASDARIGRQHAAEARAIGAPPGGAASIAVLREKLRRPQFLPTLRTLLWLEEAFQDLAIEAMKSPPARFDCAPSLARLERDLFAQRDTRGVGQRRQKSGSEGSAVSGVDDDAPAVRYHVYPSPYHEVTGWARRIDAWARLGQEGVRFRDIAVMVRDLEAYRPIVREVFTGYGIPIFIDERRDATAHPLLRLLFGALRMAAQGWSRRAVVGLLRNPLLGIAAETIDRIENLSLEYGIEYQRWWETDWQLLTLPDRERPGDELLEEGADDGLGEEDERPVSRSREEAQMERRRLAADEARAVARWAFAPLQAFTDLWRGGEPDFATLAQGLATLLTALLTRAADRKISPPAEAGADDWRGALTALLPERDLESWPVAETHQVADLLAGTLASGTQLMGTVPISAGLATRLLKDALTRASIGLVPQVLDAVTIAEPRRSRVGEVRAAILGGLDAGSFPHSHPEDPLFSDAERERLMKSGLPLASPAVLQTEEDAYLFYIACTRAREELWLTSASLGSEGDAREPSPYLAELVRVLGADLLIETASPPGAPLAGCQHERELSAALAGAMQEVAPDGVAALAEEARAALPGARERICTAVRQVNKLRAPGVEQLPEELTHEVYPGRVLAASASRLETYARCPFQHFARYLLRLEKRPEAVLTPLSTGSAAHTALERFFRARELPRDAGEAERRLHRIFRELEQEEEFRIFREDPPSSYRWDRTGRHLRLFIRAEHQRLQGSGYHPIALELSFGLEPGAPAADGSPPDAPALRAALFAIGRDEPMMLPALEILLGPSSKSGRVLLRGRIDRLDLAEPGADRARALVIDYKSREPQGTLTTELGKGVRLQVAAYLLAIRELLGLEPAGAIYYALSPQPRIAGRSVREGNPLQFSMRGFFRESERSEIDPQRAFLPRRKQVAREGESDSVDAALDLARAQIIELATGILDGRIPPQPIESRGHLPCENCDYLHVCRFDPLRHPLRPPPGEREA